MTEPPAWDLGTPHSGPRSFQRKQSLLPLQPPTITSKTSITSYGPVTRDSHCDRSTGTRFGHSASGRRLTDRSRNFPVGTCLSARNPLQRMPLHATLSPTHWQICLTPLPSYCLAIDFPGRAGSPGDLPIFYFSRLLLRGVAMAAVHCAHRATAALSRGLCEQEGHLAAPLLSFFPHIVASVIRSSVL